MSRRARGGEDGALATELKAFAVVGLLPCGLLAWFGRAQYTSSFGPVLVGLVIGVALAVPAWRLFERAAGPSLAHQQSLTLCALLVGVGLGHLLNGAPDDTLIRTVKGTTVSDVAPRRGSTLVSIRWHDGSESSEWTRRTMPRGTVITRQFHSGVLGFEWHDDDL